MKKFFLVIFAFVLFSCKGKAQEVKNVNDDCVFDSSKINDSFLKNSSLIESYKWNDNLKQGSAILKDGSVLIIKKWACVHYGLSLDLLVADDYEKVKKDWKQRILSISSIIDKEAFSNIEKRIDKEKLSEDKTLLNLNLSDSNYPEFYINIEETPNGYLYSVFYYKN